MASSSAPVTNSKDSVSKRKRTNRSAKLEQCKLEAQREQWLSHPVSESRQGEDRLHAETDPTFNDPGEVIHPEIVEKQPLIPANPKNSWASLLNSSISAQTQQNSHRTQPISRVLVSAAGPEPELVHATSSPCGNLKIIRNNRKDIDRGTCLETLQDVSGDTDASPKSWSDRSPKSKSSKVGRGSRRSRGRGRSSKENNFFEAEGNIERGQQWHFEGMHGRARGQEHKKFVMDQAEDGWEAAVDALGLHSVEKKFACVLQPQAVPDHDTNPTRTLSAPLQGLKPSIQQQNPRGRAWMQGDLRRPSSLPSPKKQQSSVVHLPSCISEASENPQCLICTENLDSTDTSFDACECQFKICLFCYHKIEQEDGRCPGCRGVYNKMSLQSLHVCYHAETTEMRGSMHITKRAS